MKFKDIPNILTVARAILVPVFMVFIIFPIFGSEVVTRIVGAVLFALISLTDMIDGKMARKYNIVSDFGKFLDPLADKMLTTAAFIGFLACGIGRGMAADDGGACGRGVFCLPRCAAGDDPSAYRVHHQRSIHVGAGWSLL